jgi:CubicO group peptidase (beta-lactamase class C family)
MILSKARVEASEQSSPQEPWAELNGIRFSGYPRRIIPDLDEPMTKLYAETGMVGQTCARAYKGNLIFTRAYGWAYKGKPEETVPTSEWIPMTTTRSCPIGSCSKSLTAVATLNLIEQGRISLNTKVIDYLELEPILEPPKFSQFDTRWKDIRIRHLLSHTSGVPDFGSDLLPKALVEEKIKAKEVKPVNGDQITTNDAIRFWMRFPLNFKPGKSYKYAAGFELLVAVLEKASGMRCDKCIKKLVFKPLKLTSATTWSYAGSRAKYEEFSRKHRFYGYGFNQEKNAYEWDYGDVVLGNNRRIFGGNIGGGFWCLSIIDAIRFVTFWPCLLQNKSLVAAAVTDQTPDHSHYGFGFFGLRRKYNEPLKWRHNGSLGGIKADMRFDAGTKISGTEFWSSDHPRRKESVMIANRFVEKCMEDGRIDQMEDLWPQYGFSKGGHFYKRLYERISDKDLIDLVYPRSHQRGCV